MDDTAILLPQKEKYNMRKMSVTCVFSNFSPFSCFFLRTSICCSFFSKFRIFFSTGLRADFVSGSLTDVAMGLSFLVLTQFDAILFKDSSTSVAVRSGLRKI